MRQAVVGLLAHVDAGKTTLAEAMLAAAGAIRNPGRVDSGSSHLDTDAMERDRGITIFSSSAALDWGGAGAESGAHLMLVDAPGHVDFSAEAERTLQALDYAVLVVGANDGVQGHTETLWELLVRYGVPTFVFVNKCDLENPGREELLAELASRLSPGCVDASSLLAGDAGALEEAASTDEAALEEYLEAGALSMEVLRRLVAERALFPVFFGAALRDDGVRGLLDGMCALLAERSWPDEFAARVYRVSRGARGERLSWVKVTGGVLRAKAQVAGLGRRGAPWAEKINEVRLYQGTSFETVPEVPAGRVCAVTGLSHAVPGSALGAEPEGARPLLAPVLSYQVIPEPGADVSALVRALRELADEDPTLGVTWHERLQEAHVQLMGEVQQDVIAELLRERHGFKVTFGPGGILYKETVTAPAEGVGHFEPLRHYAEVRLLVEPLPRGAGVELGTRCPTDDLDLNWQRLILSCAMERDHLGVLTGAPLADVRITLLAGRAHPKHTEGATSARPPTAPCARRSWSRASAASASSWSRGTAFGSRCRPTAWAARSPTSRGWRRSSTRRWRRAMRRPSRARCPPPRWGSMRSRSRATRADADASRSSSRAIDRATTQTRSSPPHHMTPRRTSPTRPTRCSAATAPVARSSGLRCPRTPTPSRTRRACARIGPPTPRSSHADEKGARWKTSRGSGPPSVRTFR